MNKSCGGHIVYDTPSAEYLIGEADFSIADIRSKYAWLTIFTRLKKTDTV